jgi:hypothetical protein
LADQVADSARQSLRRGSNLLLFAGLASGWRAVWQEARALLHVDLISGAIVAIMLALALPSIGDRADNPLMLRAFVDDEPPLTMQVDGMTAWPWGNPAHYFEPGASVPSHWMGLSYTGLLYYGGLLPELGLVIWLPLKLVGLPLFPTVPIILRALSLLFSVCTLLGVYNFGRCHFGTLAGLFGTAYLISELYFVWMGVIAHPDTLLYFLTVLALALCIRHANDGGMDSLIGIGLVAGLAQGAKFGGPLLVPIAAVSVGRGALNAMPSAGVFRWTSSALMRGMIALAVAVAVFFVSTPYAFLNSYYFVAWTETAKTFSREAWATPWTWLEMSADRLGYPLLVLGAIGLIAQLARALRSGKALALALSLLLCLTIYGWYSILQVHWVQLQYVLVPFAFVAMFAGSVFELLTVWPPHSRVLAYSAALVSLFLLGQPRSIEIAHLLQPLRDWRASDRLHVGEWLSEHIAEGSKPKVLFDYYAYFDPKIFSAQSPRSGPIRYVDLLERMPDYVVLTVFRHPHWTNDKIRGPKLSRWDRDNTSVRLYQDLLGTDPANPAVDTSETPFITHLATFGEIYLFKLDAERLREWAPTHAG